MEIMEFLSDGINRDNQGAWGMRLESQAELYFLSHVPWCRAASAWRRDAIFEFPEHVIWSRNGPAWGVVLEIPIPETE